MFSFFFLFFLSSFLAPLASFLASFFATTGAGTSAKLKGSNRESLLSSSDKLISNSLKSFESVPSALSDYKNFYLF